MGRPDRIAAASRVVTGPEINGRLSPGELVRRCISGDDQAKAILIETSSDLIRRTVNMKLAALAARPSIRADVDDICNDIFERLLRDNCLILAKLRNPDSLNAWLSTLARNHTVDYVRKWSTRMRAHKALKGMQKEDTAPAPDEQTLTREASEEVKQLLSVLSDRDRMLVLFYFEEDLTYAEIAAITRTNINTVASRIRRARLKLRDALLENGKNTISPCSYGEDAGNG